MDIFSEEKRTPISEESAEAPTRPTRVLVAEDEPGLLALMKAVLGNKDNLDTTFCTTGEEAIEIIKRAEERGEAFDRVITDNGLSGKLSGFDVAKAAKELTTPPLVVLFTGRAAEVMDNNTPEQLREKGIDLVAGKPLKVAQIMGLATEPLDQLDKLLRPQT